ncbi:MAG: glycosyl transferase group 1 [Candidatus Acidoferrum typicum]|nr:glycosyl transferase group 1 [Candidatus Acidoferrum typicum]
MSPTRRLRVAMLSSNFGEYCIRLANAVSRHADVLLLIPDRLAARHAEKVDASVRLFPFRSPRLRQPFRQFQAIQKVFREIENFAPDVVHYQGFHPWFDLALPLWHRYPLVCTVHDFRPHPGDKLSQKTPFWVEMFVRRQADQLIVHSQHVQELMVQKSSRFRENISLMPHIQIGQECSSAIVQEDEHLILFFGRIWEYKGLQYLICAEPLISARVPDVRIMIAGQGEDFSRYARMMVHPERFIVHNEFISEERTAEFFRRASVVVLPYIEASQSGVIPLAYSAAKPVVATTVGGLPEMVEDGRTGYLVAPRDAANLADRLVRLLTDSTLRRQMGANAKQKIESECSPDVIARKTIEVYHRSVTRNAKRPRHQQIESAAVAATLPEERVSPVQQ